MRRLCVTAACAGLLMGIGGCSSISSVPAGPLSIGEHVSLRTPRDWSDVSSLFPQKTAKIRVLSIDGPLLNQLYLVQGLEPGEGLLRTHGKDSRVPAFRPDMSATEEVELISDSVAAFGYQRVTTTKLRAAHLGGADAVRFDISAQTDDGLEILGTAEVAEVHGKLFSIIYLAPAEHYFGETLPVVEAMFQSGA